MQKLLDFLELKILPQVSRLAELKHLRAIRDGIVAILPLIIVGSFFLLLGQLPVDGITEESLKNNWVLLELLRWYKSSQGMILMPYRLTMQLMGLFASFSIAYNLARSYKLDGVQSGLISAAAFLLTQVPVKMEGGWYLPMKYMGGQGLFAAILCSFFTVEIIRFCEKKKLLLKMPDGVPPSVVTAFAVLIPSSIIFTTVWLFADVLHIDIIGLILKSFSWLTILGDTIWAVIIINLIMQIIWLGGIHGASVVNAVFMTIWMQYIDQNAACVEAGTAIPHITALPFYQWFIWIGGSGATLSLVIMMLFSKNRYLKDLGRVSILPGICNINEPIIFGMPIVMNPLMAVPFILVPIINGIIAYFAVWSGLVNRPFTIVPWTLPAPIGAFLACGFDWRAIVLALVNIVISGIIYYPFLKAYTKSLEKQEEGENVNE